MSAHRFLTNIDLIHAVFGHLDLFPRSIDNTDFDHRVLTMGDESAVARRTLANAALTCRAFSESASKDVSPCRALTPSQDQLVLETQGDTLSNSSTHTSTLFNLC